MRRSLLKVFLFKTLEYKMHLVILILVLFSACNNGAVKIETSPTDNQNLHKPDWSCYQKILELGIIKNSYSGTYGAFNHNAFDYKKLINSENFKLLVNKQVQSLKTTQAPQGKFAKMAFWINAYNFFTIVDVTKNYPIKSMKDLGWKNVRHQVGNTKYSLDHIEHKIVRPLGEPKIHFAINCASVSCPSLYHNVLREETINETLTKLTKDAMKNPLHISLKRNKVYVSKLLKWFKSDFEVQPYKSADGFIRAMAPSQLQKQIDAYLDYDWNLNSPENIDKVMKQLGLKKKN